MSTKVCKYKDKEHFYDCFNYHGFIVCFSGKQSGQTRQSQTQQLPRKRKPNKVQRKNCIQKTVDEVSDSDFD